MSSLLGAFALTVGLNNSQYLDQSDPEASFKVSLAHEAAPLYLWGGFEEVGVRILGQPVADTEVLSVGVGARKTIGDFFVFGEVGYGFLNSEANLMVQQEVVFTELVHNHESESRPVPVTVNGNYDQASYETSWDLKDGVMGRLGVGFKVTEGLSLEFSYRPFFVKEHIELWDEERREAGGGWWEESRNRNLSSFELGISYTFK
jgi:hypothetical protein